MRPYDVKGERDILKLSRTHHSFGGHWILTTGYQVTIASQKSGEAPTQEIKLSRARFNQLINWYLADQRDPRKPIKSKSRKRRRPFNAKTGE